MLSDILKVAFIFLVAVMFMSGAAFLVMRTAVKGRVVEVPNVIGKHFVEASKTLNQHGLYTIKIEGEKYSAKVPRDHVFKQDPVPEQKVKSGRVIKLFLSKGTELGTVPRVIDKTIPEAEPLLTSVGLEIGTVTKVHSDDFPEEGVIIAHTPPPYVTVQRGSKVNLLLSLGPHSVQVTVPDLKKLRLQKALELLDSSGLKVGRVTYEASPEFQKDIVLEQIPPPDDRVAEDTAVDIVVSSGETSKSTPRSAILRYRVPMRPKDPENPEREDMSERHVKIVLEHDGAEHPREFIKYFTPGKILSYPLEITGRGIAKIYVDNALAARMVCEWPSREFVIQ